LFGGLSDDQKKSMDALSNSAGFASNMGQNDLSTASNFFSGILSSPNKAMSVSAPQVSSITNQGTAAEECHGEFGDRSGGNTAAAANIDDSTHKQINDLIANLTGTAATNLGTDRNVYIETGVTAQNDLLTSANEQQKQRQSMMQGLGAAAGSIAGDVFAPGLSKAFSNLAELGVRHGFLRWIRWWLRSAANKPDRSEPQVRSDKQEALLETQVAPIAARLKDPNLSPEDRNTLNTQLMKCTAPRQPQGAGEDE